MWDEWEFAWPDANTIGSSCWQGSIGAVQRDVHKSVSTRGPVGCPGWVLVVLPPANAPLLCSLLRLDEQWVVLRYALHHEEERLDSGPHSLRVILELY